MFPVYDEGGVGWPPVAWAPLSARAYIDFDDNAEKFNPEVYAALILRIDQFPAFIVIPISVLRRLWPCGDWKEPDSIDKGDMAVEAESLARELQSKSTGDYDELKCLRDLAMDQLVQQVANDPESVLQGAAEAKLLADFCPRLKDELYDKARSLIPSPALLELLCTAVENETYIDLSPFKTSKCEDISFIVLRLQDHGRMTHLNLSNMPKLTNEGFPSILFLSPSNALQAVYLMENPQISVETICNLRCSCELYHSELLRRAIIESQAGMRNPGESKLSGSLLPSSNFSVGANAVTQVVWIGMNYDQTQMQMVCESHKSVFSTLSADTEPPMPELSKVGKKLKYKVFPLLNRSLSTSRLITGFGNILKWCSDTRVPNSWSFSTAAVRSFAIGSSSSSSHSDASLIGVGPLSAGLCLRDQSYHSTDNNTAHQLPALGRGQWAFIVIQQYCNTWAIPGYKRQIRYALVSPHGEPTAPWTLFTKANVPGYLEIPARNVPDFEGQAGELRAWWQETIHWREEDTYCKDKDISVIVQKIYGPPKRTPSEHQREHAGDGKWFNCGLALNKEYMPAIYC